MRPFLCGPQKQILKYLCPSVARKQNIYILLQFDEIILELSQHVLPVCASVIEYDVAREV